MFLESQLNEVELKPLTASVEEKFFRSISLGSMNSVDEDGIHSTEESTAKDSAGTGDSDSIHGLQGEPISSITRSESSSRLVNLRSARNSQPTDGDTPLKTSGSLLSSYSAEEPPLKQRSAHSFFKSTILLALVFRLLLLLFSVWQDKTRWPDGQLRFTDVDYDVFSDAARAILNGEDIYLSRPTYRYSPLIAATLTPGYWFARELPSSAALQSADRVTFFYPPIHQAASFSASGLKHILSELWGKVVFILADLACAWFQYQIILTETKSRRPLNEEDQRVATLLVSLPWLFNPVTAVVSVRGNAEPLVGVCVLSCLLALLQHRICTAGVLFGLCVHLKLYPIIYAPAIYIWLSDRSKRHAPSVRAHLRALIPSMVHLLFGLTTLFSFAALTCACYHWFGGTRFLHQAYLYHFTRSDIKHNFAPHFYPLYLLSGLSWKMNELESMTSDVISTGLLNYSGAGQLFDRLRTTLTGIRGADELGSSSHTWLNWLTRKALANVNTFQHAFNMIALIPSVVLLPCLSFKLRHHLGLCWFAVTYAFVTFNKVCTSQYFIWYLVLLPVALPHLKLPPTMSFRRATMECVLVWFAAQALWLAAAYTLEMRTPRSSLAARCIWPLVWFGSVVFVALNVWLLRRLLRWRKASVWNENPNDPCFDPTSGSNQHESKKTR